MGVKDVHCGDDVSALGLRNSDFIACVYRGLVDDYARRAVRNLALKVVKSARKKFSALIIKLHEREVSAWDYYCYGLCKGSSVFRDKFISDYIRLSLLERIDALPEEKRRLIEISACNLDEIDENTVLDREVVIHLVQEEVQLLAVDHGRSLQQQFSIADDSAFAVIALGAPAIQS